jgi:hypothetical protein
LFLTVGNEIVDGQLAILCELFDLLDRKISEVQNSIQKSIDPESDGLCDRGEYFIGVGFVAAQQYLVDTLLFTGIEKHKAYKWGPVHSSGIAFASLINSAANWWKHEAEWWNKGKVQKNGESTFIHITDVATTPGYELSNVLASICGAEKFSLKCLVPYLIEWRTSVVEHWDSIQEIPSETKNENSMY